MRAIRIGKLKPPQIPLRPIGNAETQRPIERDQCTKLSTLPVVLREDPLVQTILERGLGLHDCNATTAALPLLLLLLLLQQLLLSPHWLIILAQAAGNAN